MICLMSGKEITPIRSSLSFPRRCLRVRSSLLAREMSSPDRIRLVDLLSALLVARLLLSLLVAHNALIRTAARFWLGLWHALLAAMFAALILHAFQIVFPGHRDRTSFHQPDCLEPSAAFLIPVNAIPGSQVPEV
jgi:hypothetical protein